MCVCVTHTNKCVAILEPHTGNIFSLISSLGGPVSQCIHPTLESEGPHWGQVELIWLSLSLFICLSGCLHCFWANICASNSCAQRMRLQIMSSKVQYLQYYYTPTRGPKESSGVQSVSMSVYLTIHVNFCLSFAQLIIARRACGLITWNKIP